MATPATALVSLGADAATDFTSFIEVQLPVSKLSKECYKERKALLNRRYACIVLDEAHRARRSRPRGQEGDPNNLLRFMLEIAGRAESVLLGTATPIQIDRMELYDLMRILHRGCERILGGIGSPWRHDPREAMELVAGRSEPPTSMAQLWAWLRDPLIPKGEHPLATQVRAQLGLPDNQTAAPVDALDRLGAPLRRRLEALGGDLVRHHNPFVRHVIKRRRRDLKNPDGTPVFREVPVNLHGEGDDDALVMSDDMAAAYEEARAYCQLLAKIRPGAGILRTLLLRRIGSSLRAGLLTARKLRDGEEAALDGEEDEGLTREGVADVGGEALAKLDIAIAKMEAAGDDDPKFRVVLTTSDMRAGRIAAASCSVSTLTRSSGWPDTLRGLSPRRRSASMAVKATRTCSKVTAAAALPGRTSRPASKTARCESWSLPMPRRKVLTSSGSKLSSTSICLGIPRGLSSGRAGSTSSASLLPRSIS